MMHATKTRGKSKRGRGPTQFHGITADAKALNVNRTTLYRVLRGEWKLPTLARRYQELKRKAS